MPQDGIRLVQDEVSILELGELPKQLGEDSSVRGAQLAAPNPSHCTLRLRPRAISTLV